MGLGPVSSDPGQEATLRVLLPRLYFSWGGGVTAYGQ